MSAAPGAQGDAAGEAAGRVLGLLQKLGWGLPRGLAYKGVL